MIKKLGEKVVQEAVDGKVTYSILGAAGISNVFPVVQCTEWVNLLVALGALSLVGWRIISKIRNRKR